MLHHRPLTIGGDADMAKRSFGRSLKERGIPPPKSQISSVMHGRLVAYLEPWRRPADLGVKVLFLAIRSGGDNDAVDALRADDQRCPARG